MKTLYLTFYFLSGIIFITAILGPTLFEPMYTAVSEKTLSLAGFKKEYFENADSRIDDLMFRAKQIELQIDKLKSFFSSDKIDESKYQKEKNEMLEKAFYRPLVSMLNYIFIVIAAFLSLITLCFAVIFNIGYRSFDLRRRVKRLEGMVLAQHHKHA